MVHVLHHSTSKEPVSRPINLANRYNDENKIVKRNLSTIPINLEERNYRSLVVNYTPSLFALLLFLKFSNRCDDFRAAWKFLRVNVSLINYKQATEMRFQ